MTKHIYLIDDDEGVRAALSALLSTMGWEIKAFSNGQIFLDNLTVTQPSCVLLDIRMPGKSGMAILEAIQESNSSLPVIIMTGHGNVELCRRAFKGGALEFLTKPIDADVLIETISMALDQHEQALVAYKQQASYQQLFNQLSAREREVATLIIQGETSKQVAHILSISPRTVEAHRANIFAKLEVNSLASLIHHYHLFSQ
ncbi:response regulator transcription factor [Yersinia kristensenii]|uniref:response regulator transcription factor n=1 Tax=Yersinia kristensenii TaxID=28152 RepID=UPI000B6F957B|nr:response regulator [Yersinia kristensenii]MBW5815665.1 response regulator transcription factor [Yersinia kristensenii]MBW5831288.1 response regulator transcription factor [Yersinia kristensenii]MBW5843766.1 response regulator transcription factor [Yersinia kristensenii]MDA5487971.1 response regulator [Yersinia kristensenii]OWF85199.1 DNA-binding response regulator [Yersinia kristensenii]